MSNRPLCWCSFWQQEEPNKLKPGELAKEADASPPFSRFLEFCKGDKTSYVSQKEEREEEEEEKNRSNSFPFFERASFRFGKRPNR